MYGITVTVLEWREYESPVMIHVVKNFLSAQSIAMTYMSAEMRDCQIGVYGEPNYSNVEGIREYRWQSSDIVSHHSSRHGPSPSSGHYISSLYSGDFCISQLALLSPLRRINRTGQHLIGYKTS